MRRMIVASVVVASMTIPAFGHAGPIDGWFMHQPEGCEAVNPGQPTCTYTATDATMTPVSGVSGFGSWSVTVKRGKKKTVYKSPAYGEPTAVGFEILAGDKITAKALAPGSGLVVGGE